MLPWIQKLLLLLYALLPLALVAWSVRRRPRSRKSPEISVLAICLLGASAGVGLLLLNAYVFKGRISPWQAAQTVYLAIAAVCALKLLDVILSCAVAWVFRLSTSRLKRARGRAFVGLLLQRAIFFALAMPYITGLLISYRPRVESTTTPAALNLNWTPASFMSADGIPLAGWWIEPTSPRSDQFYATNRSIIICHGVGSDKSRVLPLAGMLAEQGYHVLLFDFRAHGESGGNFVSYGDRERLDVLAAAQWIAVNRPDQSDRIDGIGFNMGAAALVAAAAEPHTAGHIDGMILFEPFANLADLSATAARAIFPRGIAWLVGRGTLPVASLHSGANLCRFAPAKLVDQIWPRPLMVIHGQGTGFVPALQEMELYQQAAAPKRHFFPAKMQRVAPGQFTSASRLLRALLREWLSIEPQLPQTPAVWENILNFLEDARPMPVV